MRKFLLRLTMACLVMTLLGSVSWAKPVTSPLGHYQLEVPDDWVANPQTTGAVGSADGKTVVFLRGENVDEKNSAPALIQDLLEGLRSFYEGQKDPTPIQVEQIQLAEQPCQHFAVDFTSARGTRIHSEEYIVSGPTHVAHIRCLSNTANFPTQRQIQETIVQSFRFKEK